MPNEAVYRLRAFSKDPQAATGAGFGQRDEEAVQEMHRHTQDQRQAEREQPEIAKQPRGTNGTDDARRHGEREDRDRGNRRPSDDRRRKCRKRVREISAAQVPAERGSDRNTLRDEQQAARKRQRIDDRAQPGQGYQHRGQRVQGHSESLPEHHARQQHRRYREQRHQDVVVRDGTYRTEPQQGQQRHQQRGRDRSIEQLLCASCKRIGIIIVGEPASRDNDQRIAEPERQESRSPV